MTLPIKGAATAQVTKQEVKPKGPTRPAAVTDQGALSIVMQDYHLAEQWLGQKKWPLGWMEADILYQSPRQISQFENSTTTKANVPRYTVAKHVNAIVPSMMSGIFYDSPPFVLRPRPKSTEGTTRAKQALYSYLLEEMEFKAECERGLESMALNGTGIWKYGHTLRTTVEKRYIRKSAPATVTLPYEGERQVHTKESDEFDCVETEVTHWLPFFESKQLGSIFVSPAWKHSNQIWKAPYIIEEDYLTFNDLDKLRQNKCYKLPSNEDLQALFFPGSPEIAAPANEVARQQANSAAHHAESPDVITTADPLERPIQILERWDQGRVMTVLNGKLVIRNEAHDHGKPPYFSANWWNIQNAGYGIGIGRLVGSDQRMEMGVTNSALDILAFAVNQQYVRSRGANVPTQQIRSRLGGIIDVDGDVEKAFKILEAPKVPNEVWAVIQNAKQSAESVSGADEAFVQGSLPQKGGSSAARTATGAGNIAAASAGRIQGPVGRFVDNVFLPFMYVLDEMVREHMPMSEIRAVLGEELDEKTMKEFDSLDFLNSREKFEVLAGAHLAAKKAMAQSLPLMIQILENPHMLQSLNSTGWTVDIKEIFEMFMEMSEWKNSREVIRKMTPEELQLFQQANAAITKVQGDMLKQQQKGQIDAQLVDQKAEAHTAEKLLLDAASRATGYVERVAIERAMEPAALGTGQEYSTPGPQ